MTIYHKLEKIEPNVHERERVFNSQDGWGFLHGLRALVNYLTVSCYGGLRGSSERNYTIVE